MPKATPSKPAKPAKKPAKAKPAKSSDWADELAWPTPHPEYWEPVGKAEKAEKTKFRCIPCSFDQGKDRVFGLGGTLRHEDTLVHAGGVYEWWRKGKEPLKFNMFLWAHECPQFLRSAYNSPGKPLKRRKKTKDEKETELIFAIMRSHGDMD